MGSLQHDTSFQRPPFQLLPIPSDHPGSASREPIPLRSLPDLVYFDAIHNPHHVFCLQSSQAAGTTDGIGFTSITYHQLATAVELCCSWLLKTIPSAHAAELKGGRVVKKASPVALFLESDVGLFIHIIALLTLNIPVRHEDSAKVTDADV